MQVIKYVVFVYGLNLFANMFVSLTPCNIKTIKDVVLNGPVKRDDTPFAIGMHLALLVHPFGISSNVTKLQYFRYARYNER